jgi:hypothetical protein
MSWTKLSLGEPGATRRHALPVGFQLPAVAGSFTHVVHVREWQDFEPEFGVQPGLPSGVTAQEQGGRVLVHVDPPFPIGQAPRAPVRLAPGEWLRWRLNGRVSGADQWLYWLQTYNVAYGPVPEDAFLGAPDRVVEQFDSMV